MFRQSRGISLWRIKSLWRHRGQACCPPFYNPVPTGLSLLSPEDPGPSPTYLPPRPSAYHCPGPPSPLLPPPCQLAEDLSKTHLILPCHPDPMALHCPALPASPTSVSGKLTPPKDPVSLHLPGCMSRPRTIHAPCVLVQRWTLLKAQGRLAVRSLAAEEEPLWVHTWGLHFMHL